MDRRPFPKALVTSLLTLVAFLLANCGGGGGYEDTSTNNNAPKADIIVVGKLATKAATMKVASLVPVALAVPKAEGDPITVTVQGMEFITAEVGADGSFTLRGLPEGSFTLVFKQGGADIGTLSFGMVRPNQQITITVNVVEGEVVLVDEDRRGIGNSGVEIEGLVGEVVALNLEGDSVFMIAGRKVIARPGVTAIRKGGARKTVEDVTVGTRVHVKGALVEDSTDTLAYEIIIQNPVSTEDPGTGGGEPQVTICHIPPGKPDKRHTITVGASAVPAHLGHGDTEGACAP